MVDTLDDIFPGTISGPYASLFPQDEAPHIPLGFASRYQAATLTTGATLTTWSDVGPAGVAFTAASDPVVAVVAGHKAVAFDTNDTAFRASPAGAYTVLVAFRWAAITGAAQVMLAAGASNHIVGKSSTGTIILNNGTVLDSAAPATTGLMVVGAVWNGASSHVNANGTAVSGNAGTSTSGATLTLGAAISSGASEVSVYEMLIYPSALSATEVAAGVAQLMADYA